MRHNRTLDGNAVQQECWYSCPRRKIISDRFWFRFAVICTMAFLPVTAVQAETYEEIRFFGTTAPTQAQDVFCFNIKAADTTNADQLWTGGGLGLNLTGSGVTVGLWDGGVPRQTHQEFGGSTSRIVVVESTTVEDHPTHVAGTIGAAGVELSARGMAGSVVIRAREYYNDVSEMQADAGIIDLSNHSYGYLRGWTTRFNWGIGTVDTWVADRSLYNTEDPQFGKYRSGPDAVDANIAYGLGDAQAIDALLYENPHLLAVFSAGNDRTETFHNYQGDGSYMTYLSTGSSGPGWYLVKNAAPGMDGNGTMGYDSLPNAQVAKNTLVVGAVLSHTVDPARPSSIVTPWFSAYGPTDDGRCKPDVVADGYSLYSCTATSNSSYDYMTGTSMSAPNATGTAALILEHYRNVHGDSPRSATLKGLIMHTAIDAGRTGPDYAYGYGLINAADAATFITDAHLPGQSDFLLESTYEGAEETLRFLSDGLESLKFTLCWTDPAPTILPGAGLDDATSVLVHDLDMWLESPDGTTCYPWTLDPTNPEDPATCDRLNHLDNVEQIVANGLAGWYTLHLGHSGAAFMQDFTLLASGAVFVPEPAAGAFLLVGAMMMAVMPRRRRRA